MQLSALRSRALNVAEEAEQDGFQATARAFRQLALILSQEIDPRRNVLDKLLSGCCDHATGAGKSKRRFPA